MSQTTQVGNTLEIQSGEGTFAGEVIGADVKLLDGGQFKQFEEAFDQRGVLYCRGQDLTPQNLVAFSKRFGDVEAHVRQEFSLPGCPEIHVLSNIKDGARTIGSAYAGDRWHMDLCFTECPSRMSILYALEIPHDENGNVVGDTLFASGSDAYDTLGDDTKSFMEGKRSIMQYNRRQEMKRLERMHDHPRPPLTEEQKAATPDIAQPMLRTHPKTGRKAIYVNETYTFGIEGMAEDAAAPILKKLEDHVIRPENVYRHKWQIGDLLMWDNATAHHMAITDYALPQRRKLIRTSVSGTPVF
jgi:taurine dioxygenase